MRRFSMNRWWAFVLALLVSVAGVGSLPFDVRADSGTGLYGDGTNDGRTPNTPPPPSGSGDPDFPSTPGKQAVAKPGAQRLGSPAQFSSSASGEGVNAGTAVWMIRFRVAMRMLRAYYQR